MAKKIIIGLVVIYLIIGLCFAFAFSYDPGLGARLLMIFAWPILFFTNTS
jgi:hypothetical protein